MHNGGGEYKDYIRKRIFPVIQNERKKAPVLVLQPTKDYWRFFYSCITFERWNGKFYNLTEKPLAEWR